MTEYFDDRVEIAPYVSDMLQSSLLKKWPWTMTIHREKSGVYCVHTAIGTESEDTVENTLTYLKQLSPTSNKTTQDG